MNDSGNVGCSAKTGWFLFWLKFTFTLFDIENIAHCNGERTLWLSDELHCYSENGATPSIF
jgi:hypothetical protein